MNIFTRIGRFKSLLLLLLFSVAGLTNAFAQNAYDFSATVSGNTLYFKITDATNHKVEVVTPEVGYWPSGYTKPSGSIVLPVTVNNSGTDYTITSIGDWAFADCTGLTGMTFPNSVTTIGSYAFQGCSNLTGVTFPSTLTSIGNYAFSGTGITSLSVDGNIGEYAFYNCTSLTTLTLGSNRGTTIGYGAFYYCWHVTSLTIGEYMTNVNIPYAFADCHDLESIFYNATNCTFGYEGSHAAFTGAGNACTLIIGANVTSIPANAFSGYNGTIGSWGGVTSIGDYAFSHSGFSNFTIPDAVTSIGDQVFSYCSNLTSVTFGSGLTTTGDHTFSDCTSLTTVIMPSNITTIGEYSFSSCTSLNGTGITWGNVTTIGNYAFYYCTGMTNISFPSSLNRICPYAFSLTGLTTLTINVPYIESQAFLDCDALETLTIGADVREFAGAFWSCGNLENVTFNATNCTSCAGAFYGSNHTCSLTIGDGVTTLPSDVFYGFRGLNNIISWGGVTSIGDWAFQQTALTAVEVPDAVTSIGKGVFCDCLSLGSVSLGSGLTTTGNWTFYGCTGLTTVTLHPNITTIGEESFHGCTSLNGTGITFGDIETIEPYAFQGCTGMTNFTFPSSLTTIGPYAFDGTRFTNLTINLATINNSTFSGITTLTTVTIGRNVTYISQEAFKDCTSLNDVRVLSATPASGGSNMFHNTASDLVIYVPAEHLATYKTDSFWAEYADKMQGWMGTTIIGYGNSTESDHWNFIAIPYTANTLPTAIDGLIATTPANYDLYRLAPGVASTWENYKAHTEGFEFVNGQGYLYASKKDVDIVLTGAMFAGEYKDVNLAKGWNLVGNPYGQSAYIDRSYFRMNSTGDDIEAVSAYTTTTIPVCTGVVVQAASNLDVARFTYTAPSKSAENGGLQMTLAKAGAKGSETQDKAIVSFEKNAQLGKFIFNEDHAKLYIPQDGDDYAIAYSDGKGEIPLYFKAKETGTYTINFENDAKLENVYLIDKYEDITIDLSENDSYTFVGSAADRPDRFVISFRSSENSVFAYQSGNDIVVSGEGELQIFDVMGRNIMNTMINGVQTVNVKSQGVYIFKLNEKTQKVIVR